MLDWHDPPTGRLYEAIFAADVLYQLVDHEPILRCLDRLLAPGGAAIIADPHRGVADRFESLACDRGWNVVATSASMKKNDGTTARGRLFHLTRS